MKILVVGSGGREHAVAKQFLKSVQVDEVFAAPGNAGMERDGITTVAISELDNAGLVRFAKKVGVDFTFVGPETALMNGVADEFQANHLPIFAPTKLAAEIEGSKTFAKYLMAKYAIPTAKYQSFTEYEAAWQYVQEQGLPIVIKADGLAAGKGVKIATDAEQAQQALEAIFTTAGAKVVIEEYLAGEEFSLFTFVNGTKFYLMPIAQDHKRAFDGDKGPNTGGMGAYSPVCHIPADVVDEALQQVVEPAVKGMALEGRPFVGILYTGLILTAQGIRVIEFNARFGDPETQVVLPRLESDFAQVIADLLADREPQLSWRSGDVTLGVVVASDGYPGSYAKGTPLPDLTNEEGIFYAGVASDDQQQLVANGGRVYMLTATGADVVEAQKMVYAKLDAIQQPGLFYRHDIGAKGVKAWQK